MLHWHEHRIIAAGVRHQLRAFRPGGSVPPPVNGVQCLGRHAKHFCRMLHHHVVNKILQLFPAGAGLLHNPTVNSNNGTFVLCGGFVGAHGRGSRIGYKLFEPWRDFIHGKADAVERLSPDIMQTLGGIEDQLIKAFGAGAVTGQGWKHQFPSEAAPVPVPAPLPEALAHDGFALGFAPCAGGAGILKAGVLRAGGLVSQPDRKSRIVVR